MPAWRHPRLDRHPPRNHSGLAESRDCGSGAVDGSFDRRSIGRFDGCMRGCGDRNDLFSAVTALFRFQKSSGPWPRRRQIPGGRRNLGRGRGPSDTSAGRGADGACLRRRHAIGRAATDGSDVNVVRTVSRDRSIVRAGSSTALAVLLSDRQIADDYLSRRRGPAPGPGPGGPVPDSRIGAFAGGE